ncbi:MAG TPA: thiamine diphosphokinase [Chlorobiota bacterium]|nr:thiamine diphosphokinase [Chlorobiota bacterium]
MGVFPILNIGERRFDAIIAVNGSLPPLSLFEFFADVPIIAADGALNALVDIGVVAEFLVGDLDSLRPDIDLGLTHVIHDANQESNDFEKALQFAATSHYEELLVVGLHGGDLEHTLNNWSVLMRYGAQGKTVALDGDRLAIPVHSSVQFTTSPGELLSIIPQPSIRLTTRGLQWNLENEVLSLGIREGARNRAIDNEVVIEVHEGSFLLFCTSPFVHSRP